MKITSKILSIPPYISTSWNFVAALYMEDDTLIISLKDGDVIEIPALPPQTISAIFDAHTDSLEKPQSPFPFFPPIPQADASFDNQFRLGFNSGEVMMNATEHNPSQANTPDLPAEILSKIAAITKIIRPDDDSNLPNAEPHCNCIHCQVVRALHSDIIPVAEEVAAPEERKEAQEASPWVIAQTGENLYQVTNKDDTREHYNVFLGDPVGCTCGRLGCPHVIAVLKS